MKLNLNSTLMKICLVSVLWLPLAVAAPAQSESERQAEIDSARARVQRTISALEKQVALSRTLTEFVEEIGLFDNRIYGKVGGGSTLQTDKINELQSQIANKSSQLEMLKSTLEDDERTSGTLDGPGEMYDLMVEQLEQDIAGLSQELKQVQVPLEGGTELLDGALLLNEVLPPVEMLGEQAARRALENQRKLLEELDREQQKLLKQPKVPSEGSGEKRKNQ